MPSFDLTLTPEYTPTLNLEGDGGALVLELATILRGPAWPSEGVQEASEAAQAAAEAAQLSAQGSATAASASALAAASSETAAAASAGTSSTQAGIATAKAVLTAADAVATAADRVQTGLDRTAAAGSASAASGGASTATTQAGIATAQAALTAADALATAADRVQTGLDRTAAAGSASAASTSAGTATTQAGIATTKAGEADTSATLAQAWAITPEDEPVVELGTDFSALHWAAKSAISQGIAGAYASTAVDAKNAAAASAAAAVAVVTGGTASLTPAAGKIPIADANGKIDAGWLDPWPAVSAGLHRSPNAITAMCIYDTSKDSDGGAWVEKCQHTSWYNEALNGSWLGQCVSEAAARAVTGAVTGSYFQLSTDGKFYKLSAGSGTVEVFRGNKARFPRAAGIVAEANSVTIYDLSEPGRPMWMRFYPFDITQSMTGYGGGYGFGSVTMLQGILAVGAPSGAGLGMTLVNFQRDTGTQYTQSTVYSGVFRGNIAQRNLGLGRVASATYNIVSGVVNAIAMCVLPDAPADIVTGLKVPTIDVFTDYGQSRIKHDGAVVSANNISSMKRGGLTFLGRQVHVESDNVRFSSSLTDANTYGGFRNAGQGAMAGFVHYLGTASYPTAFASSRKGKQFLIANPYPLSILTDNDQAYGRAIGAHVALDYATGHLPGDIRRCYLADTVVESVGPSVELAANGEFGSGIASWSVHCAAWATIVDNGDGTVTISGTAPSSGFNPLISQSISTIVGDWYLFSGIKSQTGAANCSFASYQNAGWAAGGIYGLSSNANAVYKAGVCTHSTTELTLYQWGAGVMSVTVDRMSLKKATPDRSYKAAAAYTYGTLTKALSASANQLVAYSGFSAANYLQEPYNADLDFGTGEWSAGAWVNVPVTLFTYSAANFPVLSPELLVNGGFDDGSGWTTPGNWSISGGTLNKLVVDTAQTNSNSTVVTAGTVYKITLTTTGSSIVGVIIGGGSPIGVTSGVPYYVVAPYTGQIKFYDPAFVGSIDNVSVKALGPALIAERAYSGGAKINIGITPAGYLTATAYDGTTTRTVTTTAAYNSATWLKAVANYKAGRLAIEVNGIEVGATTGAPLLTLNNASAVLTIGNSYALDAPFPGSIALLKLGATVPTPEQSLWMYEQEKAMFRDGAQITLPSSGSVIDLTYDEASDKWIALQATHESSWTGLVRTSVATPSAGSFAKVEAKSGIKLLARTTTTPGVDITAPALGLREELIRRAEAAAAQSRTLQVFDFDAVGFTAAMTSGSPTVTASSIVGTPYIGMGITGTGVPANTVINGINGTTYTLSANCATTGSNACAQSTFTLAPGWTATEVIAAGASKREGASKDWTRLYDGFRETVRFAVSPGSAAWVNITARKDS